MQKNCTCMPHNLQEKYENKRLWCYIQCKEKSLYLIHHHQYLHILSDDNLQNVLYSYCSMHACFVLRHSDSANRLSFLSACRSVDTTLLGHVQSFITQWASIWTTNNFNICLYICKYCCWCVKSSVFSLHQRWHHTLHFFLVNYGSYTWK